MHSTMVEILDESGPPRRVAVRGPRVTIGRLPDADICLPADGVSRQHAELLRDPAGRWWLRDLNSRNGTRVNGQQMTEAALSGGERVKIGPYILRLLNEGQRASSLTTTGGSVRLTSDESGPLRSLAEMPVPRVQADHLHRLVQFGRELSEVDNPATRLQMLCELMIADGFPGRCAVAVRVDVGTEPATIMPQMLLTPIHRAEFPAASPPYLSSRLLTAVMQRRAPVLASNAEGRQTDVQVSMAPTIQLHTAVACPIGGEGPGMDVLYIVLSPAGGTGEWLAVAGLAAEQYQQAELAWAQRAVAAEHAVLQRELEQARRVQDGLVPRQVPVGGLDYAVQFHPCRWVAGDYLDIIPRGKEQVVLVVADVCGHGMQAALLASTLHALLHVLIPAGTELGTAMAAVNNYLCRTLGDGMFVTALCLELNLGTGQCRAISAGHPAPVLVQPAVSWRPLRCGEYPPLGVQPGQTLSPEDDELPPAHVLALYTDGMAEVMRRDSGQLGHQGLAEELAAICRQPGVLSMDIATQLMEFVTQFQEGSMAADDQSLMILRRAETG